MAETGKDSLTDMSNQDRFTDIASVNYGIYWDYDGRASLFG